MLLLLLSTILTSTLAELCDQSRLARVEAICEAKGRRLLQASELPTFNEEERMICACADLIPAEERNCYVSESAERTLQEDYEAHCSNLDAQQTEEEQVGLSSMFGSCTDPAKAYCLDIRSSKGCPNHWVTHKKEYNDKCGWWWNRQPCDRCCEAGKNIVDEDETGGRGGVCTCADSYTYSVGTAANCVDGTVTAATEWSDQKVTCRPYVKTIHATNEMIINGCGEGSTSCGFTYNLDRTLGAAVGKEVENSLERNEEEEEETTTTTTTTTTTAAAGDGFDWSASAMVGATFAAGAQTRVQAQLKGDIKYAFDGSGWDDLSELKLRMELNNMGFEMDSKIVLGLTAGLELSGTKKMKLGPEFIVGPQVINIPMGALSMPVMVSMKVQPIANLAISGNVAASGMFTVENVYHERYSNMFIEFDLLNFATSENLDDVTVTSSYSDMYTLLLSGELGFELRAHVGVEVDLMLYETVGVQLTPAVSTKLKAGGSASYLKRWSTTTVLPPAQTTHSCHATACIGGFVEAGLTWIGDIGLEADVAAVKDKMRPVRRQLGPHVTRRELMPLTFVQRLRQTCQTEILCTTGALSFLLADVCEIDFSGFMDISLSAPSSLSPPSMTIPIGEVCHTIGQEDGEFYSRAGEAEEVSCASGVAMTCAGCRTQSNCGGDCAWKNGMCKPAQQEYNMNPGAVCGEGTEAITTGWADCKTAAEGLGYTGDTIAHISSTIASSNRPQGCFIQGDDNNRVHYNTRNGIAHGNRFVGGDAIICVAEVATEAEQALGTLTFDALNYSSENGPRNILLTGFAMIGVFSTIAYVYQKTFKGKYETIPYPSVEEI